MTDITRKRGDTYADVLTITDASGAPVDITGYTFKMTLDKSSSPDDATNNLYWLAGTILDAANGVVEFAPAAIQADQPPASYYYDVEMIDAGGRIRTILSGKYTYKQDITK